MLVKGGGVRLVAGDAVPALGFQLSGDSFATKSFRMRSPSSDVATLGIIGFAGAGFY